MLMLPLQSGMTESMLVIAGLAQFWLSGRVSQGGLKVARTLLFASAERLNTIACRISPQMLKVSATMVTSGPAFNRTSPLKEALELNFADVGNRWWYIGASDTRQEQRLLRCRKCSLEQVGDAWPEDNPTPYTRKLCNQCDLLTDNDIGYRDAQYGQRRKSELWLLRVVCTRSSRLIGTQNGEAN